MLTASQKGSLMTFQQFHEKQADPSSQYSHPAAALPNILLQEYLTLKYYLVYFGRTNFFWRTKLACQLMPPYDIVEQRPY
jgi:hypothetical protein